MWNWRTKMVLLFAAVLTASLLMQGLYVIPFNQDREIENAEIKQHSELCRMPAIMITTTDDPLEIENCHALGCNSYIAKPVDHEKFVDSIRQLGLFLTVVEIPKANGELRNVPKE